MNKREALTFTHKIIAKLKMDDLTYTHISSRDEEKDGFLLSPFGIQFSKVKPCDLLHFKLNGDLLPMQRAESVYDHLSWFFGEEKVKKLFGIDVSWKQNFNQTGFAIHSSIYKAREDVNCIIHLHTKESIAVSVCKNGLLPASQHALHFYEQISYHSYDSLILEPQEEEELLIKDLGKNKVMFLRNHGFITMGKTIWEALFYAYHLQKACEAQVLMPENPILPGHETCRRARQDLLSFEEDLGRRDFESYLALTEKELK